MKRAGEKSDENKKKKRRSLLFSDGNEDAHYSDGSHSCSYSSSLSAAASDASSWKRKTFEDESCDDDDEEEEEEEREKEEEKAGAREQKNEKKKRRTEAYPPASGILKDGRAEFEDILDDFKSAPPDVLQSEHKPAWDWQYHPDEVALAKESLEKRAEAKRRLQSDRLYSFLVQYAAFTRKDVSKVITPAGGTGRPRPSQAGWLPEHRRATSASARVFGTLRQERVAAGGGPSAPVLGGVAGTPPAPPHGEGAPPYSPPGAFRSPLAARRRREGEGEAEEGFVPLVPALASRDEQERLNEMHAENSERLYAISGWMDRPQVIGIQDVSPDALGHVAAAFARLKASTSLFATIPDYNSVINTAVDSVRTLFAKLSAFESAETAFFFPTRNTYDKNELRIRKHQRALVDAIGRYRWDPYTGDFSDTPRWLGEAQPDVLGIPFHPRPRVQPVGDFGDEPPTPTYSLGNPFL